MLFSPSQQTISQRHVWSSSNLCDWRPLVVKERHVELLKHSFWSFVLGAEPQKHVDVTNCIYRQTLLKFLQLVFESEEHKPDHLSRIKAIIWMYLWCANAAELAGVLFTAILEKCPKQKSVQVRLYTVFCDVCKMKCLPAAACDDDPPPHRLIYLHTAN